MYRNLPGGRFTARKNGKWFVLARDKTIPYELQGPDRIGFVGSDTWNELPPSAQDGLIYSTAATTSARMSLQVPADKVAQTEAKLECGDTLDIVTSYPKTAKRLVKALGSPVRLLAVWGGGVEAAPILYPELDGIIEILDTGKTARAEGLITVRDNLQPVEIGAVWRERPAVMASEAFDASGLLTAVQVIEQRVTETAEGRQGSYTQVLATDSNKLVKKLGEESAEAIAALLGGDTAEMEAETADVLYALAIANAKCGGSLLGALAVLASRNTR